MHNILIGVRQNFDVADTLPTDHTFNYVMLTPFIRMQQSATELDFIESFARKAMFDNMDDEVELVMMRDLGFTNHKEHFVYKMTLFL